MLSGDHGDKEVLGNLSDSFLKLAQSKCLRRVTCRVGGVSSSEPHPEGKWLQKFKARANYRRTALLVPKRASAEPRSSVMQDMGDICRAADCLSQSISAARGVPYWMAAPSAVSADV